MTYDWVLFLNQDFHPTFQKEMSKQLFEKGAVATGIKNFKELNFQLIIGLQDLDLQKVGDKIVAKVDFVTPGSYSIPIEISWTTENIFQLQDVHQRDISSIPVLFDWVENNLGNELASWMLLDPED